MTGQLDYKSMPAEVKDIDMKGRRITGYLSRFGNVDWDSDIMEKGAFAKSINERKDQIFFLNQHDWKQPHGKFAVLKEDAYGLYFESEPLIDTSYSMDALKLYEAGIMKEHSIGFRTIQYDFDEKSNVRKIKEVKLFEGSNVTLGANSDTPFLGFKNRTIEDINDESTRIYKAIKNGTFTDDTFTLLEYALKKLQREAFELGLKHSKEQEPTNITPTNTDEPHLNILDNFIKTL